MMFTVDLQFVCLCGNLSRWTDSRDTGLGDARPGDASSKAREASGTDRSEGLSHRSTGRTGLYQLMEV